MLMRFIPNFKAKLIWGNKAIFIKFDDNKTLHNQKSLFCDNRLWNYHNNIFFRCFVFGEPTNDADGTYVVTGFATYLPILYWVVMMVCVEYFFGSTLGNGVVGLKPVPEDNPQSKISFTQSLKRHLLDIIDLFIFGLVGYLVITNNPKNQRLGDIWAKTIVVRSNVK